MAYGDDTEMQAWLDANGFVLPAGSPSIAQLRSRGSMHVDAHDFSGAPTAPFVQAEAWPRTGATAFGQDVPSNVIPVAIEQASYAAGYFDAMNPGVLTSRSSAAERVKRKKERVEGVVEEETEYFDNGAGGSASEPVTIPMVEGLLAPFLAVEAPAVGLGLWSIGR